MSANLLPPLPTAICIFSRLPSFVTGSSALGIVGNKTESRRDGKVFTHSLQPAKDPFFRLFQQPAQQEAGSIAMNFGVRTVIRPAGHLGDRKSTRLNSSHLGIS